MPQTPILFMRMTSVVLMTVVMMMVCQFPISHNRCYSALCLGFIGMDPVISELCFKGMIS